MIRRKRERYQFGNVELVQRKSGPAVWKFRYFEHTPGGSKVRRSLQIGTIEQYPTVDAALKAAEYLRMRANPDRPDAQRVAMGQVIDRFLAEELPERFTTGKAYASLLSFHVRPKWGDYTLADVRPFAVEQWIRALDLAPKTKRNLKSVLMVMFNCAMRWELLDPSGHNPMRLVRVPGGTKRKKKPRVLGTTEFQRLLAEVRGVLYRTVVMTCAGLGLRISEVTGLKWSDFDFESGKVHVQRNVTVGHQGELKTETSDSLLPLHPALAEQLVAWRANTPWNADSDWVFASPFYDGTTPYWLDKMRSPVLQKAAHNAGLDPKGLGWHTLRHTYSSLLRALGVDLKVQQELLRHADIRTTMNGYTQTMRDDLRAANNLVVRELLPMSDKVM
jgi:integrase